MMKVLTGIGCFVAAFLFVSYVKYSFEGSVSSEYSFDAVNRWVEIDGEIRLVSVLKTVSNFSSETDAEWIPALKSSTIVQCKPFDTFDAYADKFLIILETGHRGMIKLMEKNSLFDRDLRTVVWNEKENRGTKRAESGGYQAMPELIAWHVDRVLGLYRKPPITSRTVSSKLLYPSFLTSLLPEHQIPVTVHGWIDSLRKSDPPVDLMNYMVATRLFPLVNSDTKEKVLQISDVLVFDFLVDDHDRQAEKNWVYRGQSLLLWDNGLAFNHGPYGDSSCLDILCGSNTWRRATGVYQPCKKICVFRKSTVELIQSVGPSALEHNRLGFRLRRSLLERESDLFPLFQYGVYYSDVNYQEMVRFSYESFFDGIDSRVNMLLDHIQNCISYHGIEKVLVE